MTARSSSVSVTSPIGPAISRVTRLLFQPFDAGKWFAIGFCAWLARLGGEGLGANFRISPWHWREGDRSQFEQIRDYLVDNLSWIVPLASALVVMGLGLWVLFLWLSSRGRFLFLHCVALDKDEVVVPWHKFAREGNSLFLFRLVLGLGALIPTLALLAPAGLIAFRMMDHGRPSAGDALFLIVCVLTLAGLGTVVAVISKLTTDFVAPILFLRGRTCRDAWVELLGLLSAYVGQFVLYLLFQIVLGFVISATIMMVVFATCCFAGCLLAIPYLGTVFLLPIRVFDRSYSLYYLAQYGPGYDVFPPPALPPQPSAQPSPPLAPPAAP